MHRCNVAKRCLPSVSQIQISLTLFNVYTIQHARFQTTPHISQLYSCMHGFQTSWSLIQIFEFYFTLIMMTPSLLHPHSHLIFIIVPLTFSRACACTHRVPVGIIHRTHAIFFFWSVSHACTHTHLLLFIISSILYLSRACAMIDVPLYVCIYS